MAQNERAYRPTFGAWRPCISTPRVNDEPVRRGRVAVPGYGLDSGVRQSSAGPAPPCNPCFLPNITRGVQKCRDRPSKPGITGFHQCSLTLEEGFLSDLSLQPMAPSYA
jgi:hypothetical protein